MNFTRRTVAGIVLLNILVMGLVAFTIYEVWLEHERRAQINAQNLAQLLANDLTAEFGRIDLLLLSVVDEVEEKHALGKLQKAQLNAYLLKQQRHVPEAASLRVTDENGLMLYGAGLPAGQAIDISDREHFSLQRSNPATGLLVGKPVQAKIGGQWVIPLTRSYRDRHGHFAGIVAVTVQVDHFVRKFAQLDLGKHALVAMRTTGNISVARFPEMQAGGGAIGQVMISDQLRSLLRDNPASVTYTTHSPTDQIERIFSYRRLEGYPLYVIAGLATQDVLDEWKADTAQLLVMAAIFSVMTILFAWLLIRSWRRQLAIDEALRENEQRWSIALESGDFAVWDWDIASGKVQLSKLGKQLFGYQEHEVGNHISDWRALYHPEDSEHVASCLKEHFRGKSSTFAVELRIRCKDGNWKWIQSRGLVMKRDADGKPLRMIGLHSDISGRKQREEELRLSSTAFELADEAMIVTDANNNILSVNPAFTKITGYAPHEVIGRNPRLLSAGTHSAEFYRQMRARLSASGSWAGEVINRRKNGEIYTEWLTIKLVLDEKGELTHYVALFSDITARKETESRMRHLALHDALTDLPNRILLTERLEQAILRARRERIHLALLYFDLDKFKPVNDTHGHEVGDWLLKSVAGRVVACVRESDTVARLGGDEFVVLLQRLEHDSDVLLTAEKIREALAQPFVFAELAFGISASIGAAVFPEHGTDERSLARNADTAMYHAKKSGRNRVVLYQPGMQQD